MYFPKHSISLNIAETSYVLNSIYDLVTQTEDDKYKISGEYRSGLVNLFNQCENLWDEDEWEAYKYMVTFSNFSRKWEVDRKAEWQIDILDCDSIIFTLQYTFMQASKNFINGDKNSQRLMEVMGEILIPRFTNTFNNDEWAYYFNLSNDSSENQTEEFVNIYEQDTEEIK